MSVLVARIRDAQEREQHAKMASTRKSLVGSGDRSERIRTYNFPQGRVTDHRINLTLYKIDAIMDGDLDDQFRALAGTAISIAEMVERGAGSKIEVPIESVREGDAKGMHVLEAVSEADRVVLTHEAFSRRGFAEGAVRAAEWLATRTGCYDFRDVYAEL